MCIRDRLFIEKGGVQRLLQLLKGKRSPALYEQVLWCLSNILGDEFELRDLALTKADIVEGLLQFIEDNESFPLTVLRNIMWVTCNLTRGPPYPSYGRTRHLIPFLCEYLRNAKKDLILPELIWSLVHLSDGHDHQIQEILDTGIAERVVELLYGRDPGLLVPTIRLSGHLLSGSDGQTQILLDAGLLGPLEQLLDSAKSLIRREVVWMISNVLAGNHRQIQAVFDTGIPKKMLNLLEYDDYTVQREIIYALSAATYYATLDQIEILVHKWRVLEHFISRLEYEDKKILLPILKGMENIFQRGSTLSEDGVNPYVSLVESLNALKALEHVQFHPDGEVYEGVYKLIEGFFLAESRN
eukprot:TRINITY_DN8723_c0_g3_i4.p1 TRINITY_DN8723_c0_g3~~TRINITY_DN8723_c0_g3_i4.p1  ORF type:complete len:356 (+),score=82.48 TRINITY_DN8723_c0_g3_i4:67-1134(+)